MERKTYITLQGLGRHTPNFGKWDGVVQLRTRNVNQGHGQRDHVNLKSFGKEWGKKMNGLV